MIIKNVKNPYQNQFYLARPSPKNPKIDDRHKGGYYFQIALIFTLLFFIVTALSFNDRPEKEQIPFVPPDYVLTVQDIPETTQPRFKPPPRMPAIPVESEDIDEQLEEFVIDYDSFSLNDLPRMPDLETGAIRVAVGPRQIVEKWPEYPDSERKKKHEGIIELRLLIDEKGNVVDVKVTKNTTNSKVLEQSAVKAAREGKYRPARDRRNKPITVWTSRQYRFNLKGK